MDEFRALAQPERMYTLDDAEIVFPTVRHAVLFVEGVIKDGVK